MKKTLPAILSSLLLLQVVFAGDGSGSVRGSLHGHSGVPPQGRRDSTATVFIREPGLYSESFIEEFERRHDMHERVSLLGDTIEIVHLETTARIVIPTDLPLDSTVVYFARTGMNRYNLEVRRVNISTVEYSYRESRPGSETLRLEGNADLEPVFYFGAEGTFEGADGRTYGMNEYVDSRADGSWTYIYIGVGSIEQSFVTHGTAPGKDTLRSPLMYTGTVRLE